MKKKSISICQFGNSNPEGFNHEEAIAFSNINNYNSTKNNYNGGNYY